MIGKHMVSNMKKSMKEESSESPEKEIGEMEINAQYKHPQIARELGDHLTNDMAHFLHHPQLAPEHKQWTAANPGSSKKK